MSRSVSLLNKIHDTKNRRDLTLSPSGICSMFIPLVIVEEKRLTIIDGKGKQCKSSFGFANERKKTNPWLVTRRSDRECSERSWMFAQVKPLVEHRWQHIAKSITEFIEEQECFLFASNQYWMLFFVFHFKRLLLWRSKFICFWNKVDWIRTIAFGEKLSLMAWKSHVLFRVWFNCPLIWSVIEVEWRWRICSSFSSDHSSVNRDDLWSWSKPRAIWSVYQREDCSVHRSSSFY